MKNLNKTLIAAAVVAAFSLANVANAEPKGAELLKGTMMVKGTVSAPVVSVGYSITLSGSPKGQQAQLERAKVASRTETITAPTDGIAASPKHRQFLDEHRTQFSVAPLK